MNDRVVLRRLAQQYSEIANDPVNSQSLRLFSSINDLHMERPIVLVNEVPWHEMNVDGSLTLECEDPYLRGVEQRLRRLLFTCKHMRGDYAVEPYLPVAKVIHSTGIGVEIHEETLATDSSNNIVSHHYENQFETEEDLQKLHNPVISYDREETMRRFSLVADMVADILPVKIVGEPTGYDLGCKNWDIISNYMTVDDLLFKMMDEPEYMHALVGKLTDIFLDTVRQYEELDLIDPEPYSLHCSPAASEELRKVPRENGKIRAKNVWGRGLAQILSTVSPAMHEEFDIAYMKRAMEPFGLVYYGCCEPLDKKIDILRQIPHLRKISISPWANPQVAAEAMGRDYVLSAKPNPANLAVGKLDEDVIRKELTNILDASRKNGCACELLLKDISTVGGRPENLFEWVRIAMELVKSY